MSDMRTSPSHFVSVISTNTPKSTTPVMIDQVVEEESFEKMAMHAKEHGYDFPYLYDNTQEVVKKFRPTNTPHTFVLNRTSDGFKVAYIGAIDNNSREGANASHHYVEEAVNDLLSGKVVATPKTKAIGCGIKWKNS